MFSLHVKATMMKVSDPILFGHAVRTLLQVTWWRCHADVAGRPAARTSDEGLAG
jgi:isocitrate dehydrogenase